LVALALEGRRHLLDDDAARALDPVAGDACRRGGDDADEALALARARDREIELRNRLVDEERRRHEPAGPRGADAVEFAVERLRIGGHPLYPGLRIACSADLVLALEKARDVEVGADVLDDDVGRDAPATDGHVAVRKGE